MTLPLLIAAAFFGPSIAAFATSRPVVALPTNPPIPVISVHPFLSLAQDSCIADPPVHDGPHEQTGKLFRSGSLDSRMLAAAVKCLGPRSNFLTLSVSVDANGNLRKVEADTGEDHALADCATSFVRRGERLQTRGPGTLKVGYYMGHGRL
jgi:hypothetical protein